MVLSRTGASCSAWSRVAGWGRRVVTGTHLSHHEGERVGPRVEADEHTDGSEEAAAHLNQQQQAQHLHVHPVRRRRRERQLQ